MLKYSSASLKMYFLTFQKISMHANMHIYENILLMWNHSKNYETKQVLLEINGIRVSGM